MSNRIAKQERIMLVEQLNILISRMRLRGMEIGITPIFGAGNATWGIMLNGGIQYDTERHAFFWQEPEQVEKQQITLDI